MRAIYQGLFFSNWPDLDQIVLDEYFFIGQIVVLNRLEKVFLNMLKKQSLIKNGHPVVVLVVWGSGKGRVLTLRRHYARRLVESGRGYTKAPEGPWDVQDNQGTIVFDRLLFAPDLPPKV